MAFNARFYVNRLVKAKAISSTGDFINLGGAALDYNPDTYEVGVLTSSACQLDIDADATLGSSTVVATGFTWAAIWLRTYPSGGFGYGASATLTVKSDGVDTFASPTTNATLTFATAGISATQHLLLVTFASQTERYWRFDFTNMTVSGPTVALVMLGNYYDVTRTWDIGGPPHGVAVRHGVNHFNRADVMPDGSQITMNMRSRGAADWPMAWSLLDKTNYETLVTVHNSCRGRFLPFVMVLDDATAMSSHMLCRFATDQPSIQEPAHQLYNISMPVQEVPYIDSGEVY